MIKKQSNTNKQASKKNNNDTTLIYLSFTRWTDAWKDIWMYRVSKKMWTFFENAITLLFMEETFINFLCLKQIDTPMHQ